jgi:hypothetical protein
MSSCRNSQGSEKRVRKRERGYLIMYQESSPVCVIFSRFAIISSWFFLHGIVARLSLGFCCGENLFE